MIPIGEGVFETLRVVNSSPHALRRHLDRMSRSAVRLGLAAPDAAFVRAHLEEHFAQTPLAFGRLRIDWVAGPDGPTLTMKSEATEAPAPSAALTLDAWRIDEHGPHAGIKSTRYEHFAAARARALNAGYDDALLLNTADEVCESSTANIFYVHRRTLCTPELKSGCLPGIARGLVLDMLEVVERTTTLTDVLAADDVFVTSSLRAVQPVAAIDDRRWTTPGPITVEAQKAWIQLAEVDWDPAPMDNPR